MPNRVDRREFLTSMAVGATVLGAGGSVGRAAAATPQYPDWIAPSTKPPSAAARSRGPRPGTRR